MAGVGGARCLTAALIQLRKVKLMVLHGQTIESSSASDTNLVCAQIVRVGTDRFATALRAIVLTGSLARGEGTWIREGETRRLLGDVDVFLVFQSGAYIPQDIHDAEHEIERALIELDVVAHIGLAPVTPRFFSRMPRSIATYELRTCGCVLSGDGDVLSLIPQFSAIEISHEDAWRTLANRMIEQLGAAARDGVLSRRSQYATVKLFLDMATSYLVFTGSYRPTYVERANVLREAARNDSAGSPFPLTPFTEIVSAATNFKLHALPLPYEPERLWSEALHYTAALWNWQLGRLTGGSTAADLMQHWTRQMNFRTRLRGWASAARRSPHEVKLWMSWLRLIPQGSPRHLIYAAAFELFLRLKDPNATEWPGDAANLPLPGTVGEELGTWQTVAQRIAFNYHQLLENTNA